MKRIIFYLIFIFSLTISNVALATEYCCTIRKPFEQYTLSAPSHVRAVSQCSLKASKQGSKKKWKFDVEKGQCSNNRPPVKIIRKNVTEQELNNIYPKFEIGENNGPAALMAAVNRYANKEDLTGYPAFEAGLNRKRSVILFGGFHWTEVSEDDLNKVYGKFKIGKLNTPGIWALAVNKYARSIGHLGAIPTFEIGENRVRSIAIIPKQQGRLFRATEKELHAVNKGFIVGKDNSFETWSNAVNRFAVKHKGCRVGIPTFEIGENRERGVICIF